jgi:glycosyltransferase involved in cell wall biosynthesis
VVVDELRRPRAEPGLTITVVVCAYNEAPLLPACLYSLRAQTRPPDQILVVNNASTDDTRAAAHAVPGVTVIDEPMKGLVIARETARRVAHGDIVAYVDADCRAPIVWLERLEARFSTATPQGRGVPPLFLVRNGSWAA